MSLVVQTSQRNLIEEFIGSVVNPATKRAYRSDLEEFFAHFVGMFFTPADITLIHLVQFRDHLSAKELSNSTINRKIACLKSFLHWCVLQGFMSVSPALSLKVRKANPQSPTLAFTDEEAIRLIAIPDTDTFHGNNHKLMIAMLFMLGLRRSELVNIKLEDITNDRGVTALRVIGKGDKLRYLPLTENLKALLEQYIANYHKITGMELEPSDYLFQSYANQKSEQALNANTIFKIITRYAKRAGVGKRVSPHSCRATAISHLLEKQVSPRDVADFAGHASIQTTVGIYDKKRDALQNSAAFKVDYDKSVLPNM